MIKLRPYQLESVAAVIKEFEDKPSTLIVMPTGGGKTTVFTEIVCRMQPKRAIILVHREELLTQAVERLKSQGNIDCEIEMSQFRASTSGWHRAPCIVATVQTMYSGNGGDGRMTKFKPNDFGLLVVDEAHHYTSPSYKRVIDYFKQNPNLKVLGVTATPDRSDEEALGQVFDSVAYDYEILDAIHDGWLVPVNQTMVHVAGLDFSTVKTTAGDLNGAELAQIMEREENLQGVASASIELIGDKRTLAFTSSVAHAEMLSNIFNRHKPGMSDWVCGATPKDARKEKLDAFRSGQTQVMVNCGVLTEGFDCPEVEVIVQARPTKSRCLYAQIIGRSLRPLPGLVDSLETPLERRAAIEHSPKPAALVIDFVGNAGRHKLMSSADILGGNVSDRAIERAVARATKEGRPVRMNEVLDEEQERLNEEEKVQRAHLASMAEKARKAKLVGKASYVTTSINPFDAFQLEPVKERGWDAGKNLSPKQRDILQKQGVDPDKIGYTQGKQLLVETFRRWSENLCTVRQANLLLKHGYETKNMKMAEASKLIDALAKNGWKKPSEMLPF